MSGLSSVDPECVVDAIYEAAFSPNLWPGILESLSALYGAVGGVLFTTGRNGTKWTASDGIASTMSMFVEQGWASRDLRPVKALAKRHPGFVMETDLYSEDELVEDPVHVQFLRPRGLGLSAGTVIPVPSGDLIVIGLDRDYRDGPIGRDVLQKLDRLRPHLARAALISSRLGLEQATAAVSTFGAIGLPSAILTRQGRIIAANSLLEAMSEQVRFLAGDRMSFVSAKAQGLLVQALGQFGRNPDAVLSIAIPPQTSAPAAVAHIIPLRRQSCDIFNRGDCALVVTPLTKSAIPHADILAGLFDLTPAEARIARALADGLTAKALARLFGVSPETVRTQTKAVLAKTGAHRLVDLAGMLASIGAIGVI